MTLLGGIQSDGDTHDQGTVVRRFEAAGAISVGSTVALTTGSAEGRVKVVAGGANDDDVVIGIYNGIGGSGAADATFGGNAAASGDSVDVVIEGAVYALVDGTTDVAALDQLATAASGSLIQRTAASADGLQCRFVALEAMATNAATRTLIYVHS